MLVISLPAIPAGCPSCEENVDDCLAGADTVQDAIQLQGQLQELFHQGGFVLHKWNSSESAVLQHLPLELKDSIAARRHRVHQDSGHQMEFQPGSISFVNLSPGYLPWITLLSDLHRQNILGWFSPLIKILLQRCWERKTWLGQPYSIGHIM